MFNLLDARGVISVTERAAYIGRVRALARAAMSRPLREQDAFAVRNWADEGFGSSSSGC